MSRDVVLYTRPGCHLCDQAQTLLVQFGLRPRLIDISSDPELTLAYGTCIPVVALDGKVRFRGRVSPVLLRRLLRHEATAAVAPRKIRPNRFCAVPPPT